MKNKLKSFCEKLNIKIGIADIYEYRELKDILIDRKYKDYISGFEEKDIQKRVEPKLIMEDAKSIIVCIFPYYIGFFEDANISNYTYAKDYHIVAKEYMDKIGSFLKENINDFEYISFVDNGPLVDRYMAYISGLGFFGINNNLINDKYGSYFFIGYMINNYDFEKDNIMEKKCLNCKKCVDNCPGNAILDNYEFNPKKCISFITQKKEDLSFEEENILKKSNTIFGCDICQRVCPHNYNLSITDIDDFKEDILYKLDYEEINNISNKDFKRIYGKKSFAWRGKKVLLRNFELKNRY